MEVYLPITDYSVYIYDGVLTLRTPFLRAAFRNFVHVTTDDENVFGYSRRYSMDQSCYVPAHREGGNKRFFCPSVAYIANSSRTQRPSVPKFGRKVHHLRCT